MNPCSTLSAGLLCTASAIAQCGFQSMTVQNYGTACNALFGAPSTLSIAFSAANCLLTSSVLAFPGCCGDTLVGSLLVLGVQQAAVPLPSLGRGCSLYAMPVVLEFLPISSGVSYTLQLPASLPPMTIWAQGSALYSTAGGTSSYFAFTAGHRIDLQ